MKLRTLVQFSEVLKSLTAMSFDNAQLSWDISESIDVAEELIKKFEAKKNAYVQENGIKDEATPDKFLIKDIPAFNDHMNKLTDVDVKISFPAVTMADLQGSKVSPSDIKGLRELGILKK